MTIKKAKITDVAHHAGVSVSTVSLVLSGKGRISKNTIEKVNQSIATLGYVRNNAAANLRTPTSNLIGLILQDVTDPFYMGITSGLTLELEKKGFMLFLAQSSYDKEKQSTCIQSMLQQGVAGIILSPIREGISETLAMLTQTHLPIINIARSAIHEQIPYVGSDNALSAKMATQYLVEQGHRHIAYIGGKGESLTRAERIGGYCSTLIQYGLPFKNEWIIECPPSTQEVTQALKRLLNRYPKITAILCHDPITSMSAIYATKALGKNIGKDKYIGQDMALLGFDDSIEAQLTTPSLTVVHTSPFDIGKAAAQYVLNRIHQQQHQGQHNIIPPQLIIRESA